MRPSKLLYWFIIQLCVIVLISTIAFFLKGHTEKSEWVIYELSSIVLFVLLVLANLFFLKKDIHSNFLNKITLVAIIVVPGIFLVVISYFFHIFSPYYLVFVSLALLPTIFSRKSGSENVFSILFVNSLSLLLVGFYFRLYLESIRSFPFKLPFSFFSGITAVVYTTLYFTLRNKNRFLLYFEEQKNVSGRKKHIPQLLPFISCLLVFIIFSLYKNIPDISHYSFYIGPVYELFLGKSLLNNMPSQYGYLSIYFILGLIRFFGISFQSFHLLNIILYSLCCASTFLIYKKIVTNTYFALILCIISFGFQSIFSKFNSSLYPSVGPLRFGIGFLIVLFLLFIPKKIKMISLASLCALSLFWSVETSIYIVPAGLYVLLSFCINQTKEIKQSIVLYLKWIGYFFLMGGGLLVAIVTYEYFRFHSFPHVWNYFDFFLLYKNGFGSLKIPLIGNYYGAIAIMVLGMTLSIYSLFRRYSDDLFFVLHFLCIHNVFIFSYYVGRSHENNLVNISIFFLLELVVCYKVIVKLFYTNAKNNNIFTSYALLPTILFCLIYLSSFTRLFSKSFFPQKDVKQLSARKEYSALKQRYHLNQYNVIILSSTFDSSIILENGIYTYFSLNPSAMTTIIPNCSEKYIKPYISSVPLGTYVVEENNSHELVNIKLLQKFFNLRKIELLQSKLFTLYVVAGKK